MGINLKFKCENVKIAVWLTRNYRFLYLFQLNFLNGFKISKTFKLTKI